MITPPPRIFISYSHDSDDHRDFVLSLANKLRHDGLDCQIDQYVNGFPAEGWQRWMETQVEAADFVLLVCTPDYLQRFRGLERDGGRGVTFEGLVISQSLYDHYYQNTKFVAVIPEGGSVDDVPLSLKGFGAFRMMAEYEAVYRYLTGQARVVAPEVGNLKSLTPNTSPTDVSTATTLQSEGLKSAAFGDRKEGKQGMSDTMKAAWIGGVFVLLGAVIAGVFAVMGGGTKGDCSPIISGDVSGSISANCGGEKP